MKTEIRLAVFVVTLITSSVVLAGPAPVPPKICLDGDGCTHPTPGDDLETKNARFVGQGGDDSNDGRTHVTRWATTNPALGLPAGTHVYIQTGYDQGPREWRINWGGTESAPVVIGCYYLDAAFDDKVTSCHAGSKLGNLNRPILRGSYTAECRRSNPSTCPVDEPNAIPSSKWRGLIDVAASHIIIQDVEVRDSSGGGIRHNANFTHSDMTVQRVKVYQTYDAGIRFNKTAANANVVARDSHVELVALKRVDGRESNWVGAIVIGSEGFPAYGRIENNFVRDSGGEGIIALRVSHVVISGNILANIRRPLIYLDNTSDSVVEDNMLLGNGYLNGQDESFGVAFSLAVEPYGNVYDSVRNVFRNNLIANTKGGININVFRGSRYNSSDINPAEAGYKVGLRAYGNTVLQDKREFLVGSNLTVNNNIDYIELSNNIFVGNTDCIFPSVPDSLVKFAGNMFSDRPSDTICAGVNSTVRDPRIALDYRSVHADNIPDRREFQLDSAP